MNVNVAIRLGKSGDAGTLADLASRTFRETFSEGSDAADMALHLSQAYGPAQQGRELADPDILTLLVEVSGQLAGYAQLRNGPAPACVTGEAPIELWRFYIDSAWHGRGIANLLMDRVAQEARRAGARTLWLGVWEHNGRAQAFYRKAGFVDVGSHIFMVGRDAQTDRLLSRPVSAAPQKAPFILETDRLVLTAPTPADAEAVYTRYAGDVDVTRYLGWPRHQSIDDTRGFLAFSAAEWDRWPAGPYLIRARTDGRLLGSTGLAFARDDEAMTGYVLAKDAWGQGYATEALRSMVELSQRLGLSRLFAPVHSDNRASVRVLEKCGFTLDAGWSEPTTFPNLPAESRHAAVCYELRWRRS